MSNWNNQAQGITWTFQQYVLEALNRINSLSGGENTSYNPMAHESCLNDLWHSIPLSKKSDFMTQWDETQHVKGKIGSQDERQMALQERICAKRQIITEVLDVNHLLFDGGSPFLQDLYKEGE